MSLISGNFGQLTELQSNIAQTRSAVEAEQGTWFSETQAMLDTWADQAGGIFQELNAEWNKFTTVNLEFLDMLGIGVGKANDALQQGLATANSLMLNA